MDCIVFPRSSWVEAVTLNVFVFVEKPFVDLTKVK